MQGAVHCQCQRAVLRKYLLKGKSMLFESKVEHEGNGKQTDLDHSFRYRGER